MDVERRADSCSSATWMRHQKKQKWRKDKRVVRSRLKLKGRTPRGIHLSFFASVAEVALPFDLDFRCLRRSGRESGCGLWLEIISLVVSKQKKDLGGQKGVQTIVQYYIISTKTINITHRFSDESSIARPSHLSSQRRSDGGGGSTDSPPKPPPLSWLSAPPPPAPTALPPQKCN